MSVIKSANLLYKFALIAIVAQCLSVYSDQFSNNIELSPIITVKEKETEDKEPPAPGLSFGAPSAYGAGGGSVFIEYHMALMVKMDFLPSTTKIIKKWQMDQ